MEKESVKTRALKFLMYHNWVDVWYRMPDTTTKEKLEKKAYQVAHCRFPVVWTVGDKLYPLQELAELRSRRTRELIKQENVDDAIEEFLTDPEGWSLKIHKQYDLPR